MTDPLTTRQAQLLAFLREEQAAHGVTPSIREICVHLGISSPRSAAKLLEQLQIKGAIAHEHGARRAIRILDKAPFDRRRQIPLIGRIAAGAPITAGEHVAEVFDIDPGLFSPKADMLFRVDGESMVNKGILPRDLVGVHLQSEVRNGQIAAVVIRHPTTDDPELTIKTLQKKGPIITLISENDDQETYAPMVFDTRRDDIQVVGIYAGLIRPRP